MHESSDSKKKTRIRTEITTRAREMKWCLRSSERKMGPSGASVARTSLDGMVNGLDSNG